MADINEKFTWAVEDEDFQKVKLLLDAGASAPNAKDDNGHTALMWAASYGWTNTAKLLLDRGADPNVEDENGDTALIWAAYHGRTDIVMELLNKGADVNAKDEYDRTALHWAEKRNHTEIIELLKQPRS